MNYKTFYVSRGDEPFEQAERVDLCGFKYYGGEVPDDLEVVMHELVQKMDEENGDDIDIDEPFNLFSDNAELLGRFKVRRERTVDYYADRITN